MKKLGISILTLVLALSMCACGDKVSQKEINKGSEMVDAKLSELNSTNEYGASATDGDSILNVSSKKNIFIGEETLNMIGDKQTKLFEIINEYATYEEINNGINIITTSLNERENIKLLIDAMIKDCVSEYKNQTKNALSYDADVSNITITYSDDTKNISEQHIKEISGLIGVYNRIDNNGLDWVVLVYIYNNDGECVSTVGISEDEPFSEIVIEDDIQSDIDNENDATNTDSEMNNKASDIE